MPWSIFVNKWGEKKSKTLKNCLLNIRNLKIHFLQLDQVCVRRKSTWDLILNQIQIEQKFRPLFSIINDLEIFYLKKPFEPSEKSYLLRLYPWVDGFYNRVECCLNTPFSFKFRPFLFYLEKINPSLIITVIRLVCGNIMGMKVQHLLICLP